MAMMTPDLVAAEAVAGMLKKDSPYQGRVPVEYLPGTIFSALLNDKRAGTQTAAVFPGCPLPKEFFGKDCKELMIIVSINNPEYQLGEGHIGFEDALQLVVRMMQGICFNSKASCRAILISDELVKDSMEKWKHNIFHIRASAKLTAYLVSLGEVKNF